MFVWSLARASFMSSFCSILLPFTPSNHSSEFQYSFSPSNIFFLSNLNASFSPNLSSFLTYHSFTPPPFIILFSFSFFPSFLPPIHPHIFFFILSFLSFPPSILFIHPFFFIQLCLYLLFPSFHMLTFTFFLPFILLSFLFLFLLFFLSFPFLVSSFLSFLPQILPSTHPPPPSFYFLIQKQPLVHFTT